MATNVTKTVVEKYGGACTGISFKCQRRCSKITNDEDMRTKLNGYFDSLENPFSKLNTETKWKKHLSE